MPAVPIKKSVGRDYVICLEDGKKLKMLKRHLATRYQMTPAEYRQRWGLPKDYPMVAPAYAEARSQLAKTIGLGRRSAGAPPPRHPQLRSPSGGPLAAVGPFGRSLRRGWPERQIIRRRDRVHRLEHETSHGSW